MHSMEKGTRLPDAWTASKTLSGGEAQRIEPANALGGRSPFALRARRAHRGPHPRDTERLIGVIRRLKGGNTVPWSSTIPT